MNIDTSGAVSTVTLQNSMADLSGLDAEAIVLAHQIQRSSDRVQDVIGQMKLADAMRDAASARLNDLRTAYGVATSVADGENKWIHKWQDLKEAMYKHFGIADPKHPEAGPARDEADRILRLCATRGSKVVANADGQVTIQNGTGKLFESGMTTDQLDAEIKRFEDQIAQLDSNRQVLMIKMNQETNNKNRTISMVTNLLKAKNDAARSILNALRTQ